MSLHRWAWRRALMRRTLDDGYCAPWWRAARRERPEQPELRQVALSLSHNVHVLLWTTPQLVLLPSHFCLGRIGGGWIVCGAVCRRTWRVVAGACGRWSGWASC